MRKSGVIFAFLWFFILFVQILDMYLLVSNKDVMLDMEENPICLWLIKLNGGGLNYVVPVKFGGVVLGMTSLVLIYQTMATWKSFSIIITIALMHATLLYYFTL